LSRNRYWGTPLPIWRCPEGHLTAVDSLAKLGELSGRELADLDPHRPFVDEVTFPCPVCGETATRVPEVIDCWYDSGAMSFAQFGYPHMGADLFAERYPADYICEAIDQTRGWFYTLMAVGTLVFDQSSYKNVVCLGHILDEDGRKMSKHLGNVLEPIPLMDEHGADAVRWFMLASGSPWQARRVGHAAIGEVVRKVLLTYWNTAAFLSLYARAADWTPASGAPSVADRPALDRWVLSEAHRLAREVDTALEHFDTQRAGRLIQAFVDDLSNWYVRRTRRRFWDGDPAALATLDEALRIVTLVMAPFTPFVTERVWQDMVRPVDPDARPSVHMAPWPASDDSVIDDNLAAQVALVRRVVELGRAARAASSVRTRQPLARALVSAPGWSSLPPDLVAEVASELNVLDMASLSATEGDLVDVTAKANFRSLGKRYGKQVQEIAAAIAAADAAALAAGLRAGSAHIDVPGVGPVDLTEDDVVVTETPREGWSVASGEGETVALDLELTDELRRLGIAREAVRLIQEGRKSAGLDISDRIALRWEASEAMVAEALREHGELIAAEVLATSYDEGAPDAGDFTGADDELGLTFGLHRA
ncbi:MAG: class I tRNA ligase family protein, partial [Candidatus Nanopelagicales bacterium]